MAPFARQASGGRRAAVRAVGRRSRQRMSHAIGDALGRAVRGAAHRDGLPAARSERLGRRGRGARAGRMRCRPGRGRRLCVDRHAPHACARRHPLEHAARVRQHGGWLRARRRSHSLPCRSRGTWTARADLGALGRAAQRRPRRHEAEARLPVSDVWDDAALASVPAMREEFDVVREGFDLFRFPENANILWFDASPLNPRAPRAPLSPRRHRGRRLHQRAIRGARRRHAGARARTARQRSRRDHPRAAQVLRAPRDDARVARRQSAIALLPYALGSASVDDRGPGLPSHFS